MKSKGQFPSSLKLVWGSVKTQSITIETMYMLYNLSCLHILSAVKGKPSEYINEVLKACSIYNELERLYSLGIEKDKDLMSWNFIEFHKMLVEQYLYYFPERLYRDEQNYMLRSRYMM